MKEIIILLSLLLSPILFAAEAPDYSLSMVPNELKIEIASKLVDLNGSTEDDLLKTGDDLCNVSCVNKQWNKIINDQKSILKFIDKARDVSNIPTFHIAGLLRVKGMHQFLKSSPTSLVSHMDFLELIASHKASEKFALKSQAPHSPNDRRKHAQCVANLLQKSLQETESTREYVEIEEDPHNRFLMYENIFRYNHRKFLTLTNVPTNPLKLLQIESTSEGKKAIPMATSQEIGIPNCKKVISPFVTQKEIPYIICIKETLQGEKELVIIQSLTASLIKRTIINLHDRFSDPESYLKHVEWYGSLLLVHGVEKRDGNLRSILITFSMINDNIPRVGRMFKDEHIESPQDVESMAVSETMVLLGNSGKINFSYDLADLH